MTRNATFSIVPLKQHRCRHDVRNHARNAVLGLTQQILQVQAQAKESKEAVLEFTRDMKRLDYAKRHLKRTITALKRLHIPVHAAEQLRMAAMVNEHQRILQYRAAAHLIVDESCSDILMGTWPAYTR